MPKNHAKSNQQLTVPQHFHRQEGSSKWYVRLVPPTHLKGVPGVKEYRKSTGHADLRRAKPVGQTLIAEKLREWDALARATQANEATPTILTQELIDIICAARLYSWMRNDDEERLDGIDDEQLLEIDSFCELTDKAMRSVLAQGSASSRWPEVADSVLDWCLSMRHDIEPTDPSFPLLIRSFAKVEKEAQSRIALRNEGEDTETPAPPRTARYKLSDVTNPFEEFKSINVEKKHLSTTLNAWKLFIEYSGDIPLDSVTAAHIYDFMQHRMHASTKPWSESRAKSFGKRVLREIFGFARTKGFMTILNPIDALEVFPSLSKSDEASRKKPRYPFKSAQLNSLFAAEWYDPNDANRFRGKMRTDLGARYWIPLFGLFHGNRVSEALQLIASDFSWDNGVFVVHFQTELEDADGKPEPAPPKHSGGNKQPSGHNVQQLRHLKTLATKRLVPVHPKLLELGLEDFIAARRKDGPNALLFPSSMPNKDSENPKLGRAYEQAFLRFVRDHLGFGSGYGSHSFRHQLEDRLRNTQADNGSWPAGMSQQYTGRKRTREADRKVTEEEGSEAAYGNGYIPQSMLRYISQIDFSDITLPKPFGTWLPSSR
jgi:integrase